jgi:hypothetical protein
MSSRGESQVPKGIFLDTGFALPPPPLGGQGGVVYCTMLAPTLSRHFSNNFFLDFLRLVKPKVQVSAKKNIQKIVDVRRLSAILFSW